MICGIDIGGTFTRIGIVDSSFNVYDFKKIKTKTVADDFSAFIKAYISTQDSIERIVIGFPGVVNPETKKVLKVPNQKTLEHLDILALENELNLPIDIYKDTVLLFKYDQRFGRLKAYANVLGFYLGTGLGNIIFLNHHIHYGDFFAASELGHQGIQGSEKACPCGLKGCFETVCSGHFLKYLHSTYFSEIPFEALFTQYHQSDHREKIERFIDDFAFIIASQMHILDVKHIIIGGGIPSMKDFPKDRLHEKIDAFLRHPKLRPASIYWSDNDPMQGVIGAATLGYEKENKI